MRRALASLSLFLVSHLACCDGFGLVNVSRKTSRWPIRTECHSKTKTDNDREAEPQSSRRKAITDSAKLLTALLATTTTTISAPSASQAAVTVDPDRYGDKELKMATVNIVKGRVRDVLTANPQLTSPFLQLSMYDALTYDASTGEGGPDGSIVPLVLADNPPRVLAGLAPAARELEGLRKSLQRTTEITMADVVALAGAEAIETAGGPRLVVQLGKGEPRSKDETGGGASASARLYPDLSGRGGRGEAIAAFRRAGLTERDVALFYGIKFALDKVVDGVVTVEEEEQEVNEMGETEVSFPSSFGSSKEKYGKQIGKLDKAIFASIMAGVKKKDASIPDVFYDANVAQCAQTYAAKKADYLKDLKLAYGSWMSLGAQYTGGGILLFDSNY